MRKFIILHTCKDNGLISIAVDEIVCAAVFDTDTKSSQVYIDGDEENSIVVNEKLTDIMKRIGDARKFIMVHSQSSNNEVLLPSDVIMTVREINGKRSRITISNNAFAEFDINESVTTVTEMLNKQ